MDCRKQFLRSVRCATSIGGARFFVSIFLPTGSPKISDDLNIVLIISARGVPCFLADARW